MTESSTQEDPKTDLDSAPRGRLARGSKVIADHVKRLPNKPGVYRMFGEDGEVLYVGKAKNLKNRVTSYTRMAGHTNRIARMISATVAMEFITTTTETEALLLEANMIKRLRPRFNVVLRDDKSFPYILITEDHEAPQIVKHRGARRRKGKYFGPFASAGSVDRTINALQRAFLLRSCTDSVYESRARPCLLYQIKRCSAPCTGEVSPPDYAKLVDEARGFLSGKSQAIRAELSQQMEEAAAQMEFESAAIYRDRLQALSHTQGHQGINPRSIENADIFACHIEGGQACVQVFFIRTGQNWGNRAYFPRMDKSHSAGEILESFLGQFYDDRDCPPLILVSEAFEGSGLLSEALSIKLGRKVQVAAPKRGERRELVTHALTNAREALGRKLADTASQTKLLSGIAEAFELDASPRRIEVYDNSHIQGSSPIGAMIVAGPDGFIKNQYRKFNIKDSELTPGDDYAMMREVLTRRFSRLLKEHPRDEISSEDEGIPAWPDLLLIDGGKGQLSAVRGVLDDLGLSDITTVGVAKGPDRDAGRERFFIEGRDAITLPGRDPVLYYIQRLRDEAHRFAIGTHRARRKKAMVANPLDEIAGIGPTRKKALLHHFGSAKAVSRAKISDLRAVDGVSATMAQTIFDHFHDKG